MSSAIGLSLQCLVVIKSSHMVKTAGLFKYVWPFCYHQALKGLMDKTGILSYPVKQLFLRDFGLFSTSSYVAVYLKLLVLFASEFVYETMTSLLVGLFLTSRYCICNSSKNAVKGFLMFSGGSKGNIGKKRIKTKLNSISMLLWWVNDLVVF